MGPLSGIKIVELAGAGPGPFAAMMLADLGATVIRIERLHPIELGIQRPSKFNPMLRNRQRLALDLKQPEAIECVLKLIDTADALIEGYRPGVMERLGLGPDICMDRNPRLVYGRVTGWGQTGPLANAAGHDLNYIALTGALATIGRQDSPPSIPPALLGDFAGGGLTLCVGLLSAILEARMSGKGQIVDAAIVDGVSLLAASCYGLHAAGLWSLTRGSNILDSGAPFYDVYECKDGQWISIGPIESRFYSQLLEQLGLDPALLLDQYDRQSWPRVKQLISDCFKKRSREAWCELLEGTDVCFAPVLSLAEAPLHPHLQERNTFVEVDGVVQPSPAPRFSRSVPAKPRGPTTVPETDFEKVFRAWNEE